MSGIIGSRFNNRGSGLVGSLGTDGQIFTSSGAGVGAVYEDAAGGGGAWTTIKVLTASSSSTLEFVNGASDVVLDATYDVYMFQWTGIHPQTNATDFTVNFTEDGTNWNKQKCCVHWRVYASEANSQNIGGGTQTVGTGEFQLTDSQGSDGDHACAGHMFLYDPSDTTLNQHFSFTCESSASNTHLHSAYGGGNMGHGGNAGAITGVRFTQSSGYIDEGRIGLYGLAKS
jgi:hypothetical protein